MRERLPMIQGHTRLGCDYGARHHVFWYWTWGAEDRGQERRYICRACHPERVRAFFHFTGHDVWGQPVKGPVGWWDDGNGNIRKVA